MFHQAAHKAVLRSVERPLTTDTANTHGTLNMLKAAADAGARRFVHASSSSVYGGATTLPTPETEPLVPRSPVRGHQARGRALLPSVRRALRARNRGACATSTCTGRGNGPDATYAAVIPLFVDALLHGRDPEVHGDGLQSRDFTYISDVVAANLAAAAAPAAACSGHVYNIAPGIAASLLDILRILGERLAVTPAPHFVDSRAGDVKHSLADASAAARDLDFHCTVGLEDGLTRTVDWLRTLA